MKEVRGNQNKEKFAGQKTKATSRTMLKCSAELRGDNSLCSSHRNNKYRKDIEQFAVII